MASREKKIIKVAVDKVQPHPLSRQIYTNKQTRRDQKLLTETMRLLGQLEPIIINSKGFILSGNRRWLSAQMLDWKHLDAIVVEPNKGENEEDHVRKTIVFHNQQRKKTYREVIHEAEAILGILGKNQGQRRDLLKSETPGNHFGKIGQDRFEIAAKVIGNLSGTTLRRLIDIVEFERENKANGELGIVEKVVKNEVTVSRGFNIMRQFEALKVRKKNKEKTSTDSKGNKSSARFLLNNDSSEKMESVQSNSIQLVITSPPYYNLRNYGNSTKEGVELGMEATPLAYVKNLVKHFGDVKRVLKKSGSFFLNIGDTYLTGKNLLIPSRLVLELCDRQGWFLVNEIIWKKLNPLPQNDERRLQPTYEKIFHLVLDPEKYYYKPLTIWNNEKMKLVAGAGGRTADGGKSKGGVVLSKPYKKLKDFIEEQNFKDVIIGISAGTRQTALKKTDMTIDHPAVFPEYLPILPILTTTQEGDTVLDPFSGSGTTGTAAILLGRNYTGYELNKKFFELSKEELDNACKVFETKQYQVLRQKFSTE